MGEVTRPGNLGGGANNNDSHPRYEVSPEGARDASNNLVLVEA